jgi:hypothetical protein
VSVEGVDYAFTSVDERALAAAGKRFAMRYVGPGLAAKHLTAAERDRIWAAGLGVVLLAEGAADSALGGFNTGLAHGEAARAAAEALGAPSSAPIYFAVDFQVTATQWPLVAAYLRGCASRVGAARVGVYGSYSCMAWAARDKVAAWFFQTYAWSGGNWWPGNHVEQYHNGVALAGGDVDLCRAKQTNYGQWRPADMELTDKLPSGTTDVGHALDLLLIRTNYLANVAGISAKLDKILAAASADTTTSVSMTPEDRADLVAQLTAAIHLPTDAEIAKAVNDDEAARLQA